MKARFVYLHTVDGRPAEFDRNGGQIVWSLNRNFAPRARKTLREIKSDQKRTKLFREERGFDFNVGDYGYIRIKL